MLHNAGEYQERQYLEVVQSKSWRETRRGSGKVEVAYCPPKNYRDMRLFIYRLTSTELHSALKLEKSAISKVQKTLFAFSKMAKNKLLPKKKV